MKLQEKRVSCGLSQSELAAKSGLSVRTLQAYEQGAKSIDSAKLDTLVDLAVALDCSIVDILESEELIKKCRDVGIW